jgi:hypothetical protein
MGLPDKISRSRSRSRSRSLGLSRSRAIYNYGSALPNSSTFAGAVAGVGPGAGTGGYEYDPSADVPLGYLGDEEGGGAAECTLCSVGRHSAKPGAAQQCAACPTGSWTRGSGSAVCDICDTAGGNGYGYYNTAGCAEVGGNATCVAGVKPSSVLPAFFCSAYELVNTSSTSASSKGTNVSSAATSNAYDYVDGYGYTPLEKMQLACLPQCVPVPVKCSL